MENIRDWYGMKIIRVSSAPEGFSKWLGGQTMPLVEDDEEPCGWAYYDDYVRFMQNKPIID
jgi:hypothetical protein